MTDQTRMCLDPWLYLEVTDRGEIKPCCLHEPVGRVADCRSEADARALPGMAKLRTELFNGNLSQTCRKCHIRKMVPVQELRTAVKRVRAKERRGQIARPTELRIDLTGKCNLRCAYCLVTAPGYEGHHLQPSDFATIWRIVDLMPPTAKIYVNGHGETTYHPEWVEFCEGLFERGRSPAMTTNLAKRFSEKELSSLARFRFIQVSVDSAEDDLMKRVRKAVTFTRVCENMEKIRARAGELGVRPPIFGFSTGVYDLSLIGLADLVERGISLGVAHFTFWNLVKHPHNKMCRPVSEMSGQEAKDARKVLTSVRERLSKAGRVVDFAGDFQDADGDNLMT